MHNLQVASSTAKSLPVCLPGQESKKLITSVLFAVEKCILKYFVSVRDELIQSFFDMAFKTLHFLSERSCRLYFKRD